MKRIVKLLGMFLVWNFSFSPSFGDDLVTILSLALENDPTLRQAKASYLANHETVAQSRSSLLPSFGLTARTTRLTSGPTDSIYVNVPNPITGELVRTKVADDHSFRPGVNNHDWGIGLNQSLVNLSNWYNFRSAKASDQAAAANLAAQEQDLIMRVSMAYFDVLRAQELLETNLQEEEAALTSLQQTQQREAVGLVAITDVYDAQAAYDLARNTTILQQDILQARYEALEALTGQAHPEIEILREDFPIIEVDGNLREWEMQADDNNLAVAAAEFNLDASRQNLKARKSDHLPTLDLSGFYGHIVTAPIVNQGIQILAAQQIEPA